ncbi:unnamed protein product [Staurois parvus]|uniref:Cytochrome P450 n=1 Tax=Staurois parvus TaxID=386267 RepID=A0ABN9AH82_9NEOB|nr:unnamed protein product [Staurois parvus]
MLKPELIPFLYSNVFLLVFTVLVCFFLLDFVKRKKGPRFPPGPRGVPFLGNILQVDFSHPMVFFNQVKQKFGDIVSVQFFWHKIVVLNGFESMKEALINRSEDIADRPRFPLFEKLGFTDNTKGLVIIGYGKSWREQRRFTLSTLRNFGMGKKSLEERVAEEAQCLCTAFKSYKGHPFDPHYLIDNAVSNVICSITFGDRFEYDDAKFQKLLHLLDAALESDSGFMAQVLNEIPWLLNIPWLADFVLKPDRDAMAFLKEIISEHKNTYNPNYIRDFIDAYLLEMEKEKESESSFTERNLLYSTYDLFTAGTGTTSTTLRWALIYMLLYPNIQGK